MQYGLAHNKFVALQKCGDALAAPMRRHIRPVFYRVFKGCTIMYPTTQKRFYSPQFSEVSAISVRRLAWSLGLSMPRAVDHVVGLLPSLFPSGVVCLSCKDNTKCQSCACSPQSAAASAVPAV
jgi:hypothetical protein